MEDKSLIFFGTLGLFTFNLLVVLFSIIAFNSFGLYALFFTIPFGLSALYFDYLVARYFILKFKELRERKAKKNMTFGAVQQQKQSKFWDFVEKLFVPVGWLFDWLEEKLEPIKPYVIAVFDLIGDFVVIYTIYFILTTPAIPWLWIFPVLLITVPVLYFFHLPVIDGIKKWLKKRKENKE